MTAFDIYRELSILQPGDVRKFIGTGQRLESDTSVLRAEIVVEPADRAHWNGIRWKIAPPIDREPRAATYGQSYVGLTEIECVDFEFDGSASELVDFYSLNSGLNLVSDRLHSLLLELDEEGFESREANVQDIRTSESKKYHFVLVTRVLKAFDFGRSSFELKCQQLAPGVVHKWLYPEQLKYFINTALPSNVQMFAEYFMSGWFCGPELIKRLLAGEFRGIDLVDVSTGRCIHKLI